MDEGLAGRLKRIRTELDMSARKLSLELGVNGNAWSTYEAGTSLPSAPVLEALCRRGVNLNWLMLGDGDVWRNEQPQAPQDLRRYVARQNETLFNRLGLGRLAMMASGSTLRVRLRVAELLTSRYPTPLGLDQLAQQLKLPIDQVAPALLDILAADGAEVIRTDEGDRYRGRLNVIGATEHASDVAQLTLDTVETLVEEVFPTLVGSAPTGILFGAKMYVGQHEGRARLKSLVESIRGGDDIPPSSESDTLTIVFGACYKEGRASAVEP